jgi:hypothetical protein
MGAIFGVNLLIDFIASSPTTVWLCRERPGARRARRAAS